MKTISTKNYTIEFNGDRVYFEHDRLGEDSAGSIRFELRRLVDYSGTSFIPREVVQVLHSEGYIVREDDAPFSLNLS